MPDFDVSKHIVKYHALFGHKNTSNPGQDACQLITSMSRPAYRQGRPDKTLFTRHIKRNIIHYKFEVPTVFVIELPNILQ